MTRGERRGPLATARQLLRQAKAAVVLVGPGGRRAVSLVAQLASRLGAATLTTPDAKSTFDETAPSVYGVFSFGANESARWIVRECDVVVAIGTNLGEFASEGGRAFDHASIVQVIDEPSDIPMHISPAVTLLGDIPRNVRALSRAVEPRADEPPWFRRRYPQKDVPETYGHARGNHISPFDAMRAIAEALPRPSRIVCDVTSAALHALHDLTLGPDRRIWLQIEKSASMGAALSAGIGIRIGSGLPTLVLIGDWGFMAGNTEIHTAVSLSLSQFVIVVWSNAGGRLIRTAVRAQRWDVPPELYSWSRPNFERVAQGYGMRALTVRRPRALARALKTALQWRAPVLIDAIIEPDAPIPGARDRYVHLDSSAERGVGARPEHTKEAVDLPTPLLDEDHSAEIGADFGDAVEESGRAATELRSSARHVLVTAHGTNAEDAIQRFPVSEPFRLRFRVGAPRQGSFARGDIEVPTGDIPPGGLPTTWVVTSVDVELVGLAVPSRGTANRTESAWVAAFNLVIPESGDSDAVDVVARIPSHRSGRRLIVVILSRGEVYRRVEVVLEDAAALTIRDQVCADARHLNLRPPNAWATPPEGVVFTVVGPIVAVASDSGTRDYRGARKWYATEATAAGLISTVRAALESFRERWSVGLDDLDDGEMQTRLAERGWEPHDFANLPHRSMSPASQAQAALRSDELLILARRGYNLYNTFFPEGSEIRQILEDLRPGAKISINWVSGFGDFIAHVPWALMYTVAPQAGVAADAARFLGFRFRLSVHTYDPLPGSLAVSRALGAPPSVRGIYMLFWGKKGSDPAMIEARWQARTFGAWPNQVMLPSPACLDAKGQVLEVLENPRPSPASVLYLYCHASVGNGSTPVLRFGDGSGPADTVQDHELPITRLKDAPLVFANACTTARSDPRGTSELEASFFRRGIRSFIGTETKVPVRLASRFAWLFFQFFQRRVSPDPLSAGEALTQARLFLFTQYGNLGGLFYCQTNGYDLYLASNEEVEVLRRTV